MRILLSLILISACCSLKAQNGTLQVVFEGLQSARGLVQYGIYLNPESFDEEKPHKLNRLSKANLKNGQLTFTLVLPNGSYGLSALDDENTNGKMDYNLIGMPT